MMASVPNSRKHSAKLTTLLPFLLFLTPSTAQSSDRNCTANETVHGLNSYNIQNATGTYSFEGFGGRDAGSSPPGNWTWSIGFQNIPSNTTNDANHWYDHFIWLDTHGVDLADEELDYEMCYLSMSSSGWDESIQENGEGDSGHCEKFLGEQCAEDWRKALIDQANSGSTEDETPCHGLRRITPESCKSLGGGRYFGTIPPENRTCPFGLGDPDYDTVLSAPARNDTGDLSFYDDIATQTIPLFVAAWQKGGGWADARVMCLSATNFTEGSRVPDENGSVRLEYGGLLFVSGLMALALV